MGGFLEFWRLVRIRLTPPIVSFLESMSVGCDLDVAAAVAAARDIAAMTDIPLLSRASAIMAAEGGPAALSG